MVPGYRHREEPISALASSGSPAAVVMVPGFLGLAAGTWLVARESSVPGMLRAAAVTTAGAGLARCSTRSCPSRFLGDEDATVRDELHGVCSMATFLLWIAAPAVTAVRRGDRRSAVFATVTAAAWVAAGVTAKRRSANQGLAQRLMVASALAWFPVVS